jgi:molecular chaperone DnaK
MSESRDISVSAYLNMADQEFKEIFNPKVRTTSVNLLNYEVKTLSSKLDDEIEEATEKEDYPTAAVLKKLKDEMENISDEAESLTANDVTGKAYPIEDKKRKIAQEIDAATKHKRIQLAKDFYFKKKEECNEMINDNGNDYERKAYNNVEADEPSFLSTNSPLKIQEKTDELNKIIVQIRWRTPDFLIEIFNWLKTELTKMNNPSQAKSLIDAGKFAIESKNWDRLKEIDYGLIDLLPDGERKQATTKIGF